MIEPIRPVLQRANLPELNGVVSFIPPWTTISSNPASDGGHVRTSAGVESNHAARHEVLVGRLLLLLGSSMRGGSGKRCDEITDGWM